MSCRHGYSNGLNFADVFTNTILGATSTGRALISTGSFHHQRRSVDRLASQSPATPLTKSFVIDSSACSSVDASPVQYPSDPLAGPIPHTVFYQQRLPVYEAQELRGHASPQNPARYSMNDFSSFKTQSPTWVSKLEQSIQIPQPSSMGQIQQQVPMMQQMPVVSKRCYWFSRMNRRTWP